METAAAGGRMVPRVLGVVPRLLGVVPRVVGVVPRVVGVVPRVLGVVPRVLGVVPRSGWAPSGLVRLLWQDSCWQLRTSGLRRGWPHQYRGLAARHPLGDPHPSILPTRGVSLPPRRPRRQLSLPPPGLQPPTLSRPKDCELQL